MKKDDLFKCSSGDIFRILSIEAEQILAIDCHKKNMPKFFPSSFFDDAVNVESIPFPFLSIDKLSPAERKIAHKRYTMIAAPLAYVNEPKKRSRLIAESASRFCMSKQSIRSFLCTYLVYQDIAALAPRRKIKKELTTDQKNMRWALNKFFYTRHQNSLPTAYTMMLKSKYCDTYGVLLPEYPTFHQFRYFYRKTRKLESYYISRNGITEYQRNHRPLLGESVQEFAPSIGTAMLDGTICDIYLVNEAGQLIGRPILLAACDANTSLCLGYSLLLEGGTYSLQHLMFNILEDKVALCEKMGIQISPEQWPTNQLPAVMVTDNGAEYKSQTFEQIVELGVTLIHLPPFRPELKGSVEKLFDLIQSYYKDALKGKGVIMPDYQERGSHDYRKDAVLTLKDFEKVIVRCIIHYNCERIIQNYPYTPEMLDDSVLPYANKIWNWKLKHDDATNLITVSKKEVLLTLLPRTTGKFTRYGLKVNKLRYYADGYKARFLEGGDAVVAYNQDNCSKVWLHEADGSFVEFSLIERRFEDMSFSSVNEMQKKQKQLVHDSAQEYYQHKIELLSYIENISAKERASDIQTKNISSVRKKAKKQHHKDLGGMIDE